ncbi:methyltransferase [Actinoplanes italicus]|uniref:Methyltransferase family protein n=1 Tax=Actinoplanes italicus TaxID=113567 RepID=A0A2T0JY11_9ACTN|nr:class I SAM-dependent methyltransferase [Actinoplanes italicus]PRX12676.1 methyltransferase family protein [Actinoplanes italicus]GIE35445.1 methyltransferase [Actinoplanes italicus]
MGFEVAAEAYGKFMGRFSEPLAATFADLAGIGPARRALDVGCGPGALTAELIRRGGTVTGIDPSEAFVAASRARFPGVDIRLGSAEDLPFGDDAFDCALAQLVVHFMTDPVAGLREMARVTRPGGTVAACVWDHAGGHGPLSPFWRAVRDLDPDARDESRLAGTRQGELNELLTAAGLRDVTSTVLTVTTRFAGFEEWWEPYTFGVGPAGDYVRGLDPARREALRDRCAAAFGVRGPFDVTAAAWAAAGRV